MLQRTSRKLEKKLKELVLQAEDERRHADQYKEQVSDEFLYSVVLYHMSKPYNRK